MRGNDAKVVYWSASTSSYAYTPTTIQPNLYLVAMVDTDTSHRLTTGKRIAETEELSLPNLESPCIWPSTLRDKLNDTHTCISGCSMDELYKLARNLAIC